MGWLCIAGMAFICMILSITSAVYSTSSTTLGISILIAIWSALCTAWAIAMSGFFDKKDKKIK